MSGYDSTPSNPYDLKGHRGDTEPGFIPVSPCAVCASLIGDFTAVRCENCKQDVCTDSCSVVTDGINVCLNCAKGWTE